MTEARRRVLLVGWDGADWGVISPLVDQGKMPNVARLIETGVMGNLASNRQPVCPALWTTVATGKHPHKHGIHGSTEPDPVGQRMLPVSSRSRQTKAIWNMLGESGLKSVVVGWPATRLAEPISGLMISDDMGRRTPATRHAGSWSSPPELESELAGLWREARQAGRTEALTTLPELSEVDTGEDRRVSVLRRTLGTLRGLQALALHGLQTERDWSFAAIQFPTLDRLSQVFMGFHPPRMAGVDERAYQLYHGVIEMGYRMHDAVLGTLMQAAGPDTTVMLVSDHGFYSDHLRPAGARVSANQRRAWRRYTGVFVASGSDLRRDEMIYGASLVDIAPTLLSLFGLPVGRDMDGRVLQALFQVPRGVEQIESWDRTSAPGGWHPPERRVSVDDCWRQFVTERQPGTEIRLDSSYAQGLRNLRIHLSDFLVFAGRLEQACDLLAQLWRLWPGEHWIGLKLLDAQLRMTERQGHSASPARETLEVLKQHALERPGSESDAANAKALAIVEGRVLRAERRFRDALSVFNGLAETEVAPNPRLRHEMGELALALADPVSAERHFTVALAADPDSAPTHLGMARAAFQQRDWRTAHRWASAAIGIKYRFPQAHCLAGAALCEMGEWPAAERALDQALALAPGLRPAHRMLARVLYALGRHQEAARHKRLADDPGGAKQQVEWKED